MARLQKTLSPIRIVSGERTGDQMEEAIACLRKHADGIEDTATRCTDPQIAMELQFISAELRRDADSFEGK